MSQKLVQHHILNYTGILKWLRKILECRNQFLKRHRDNANNGSRIQICKQAHIKLEVVFFIYLWSIDPEAVLVSMSCFSLLCEEADILCGTDDYLGYLLPNYHVYEVEKQAKCSIQSVVNFKHLLGTCSSVNNVGHRPSGSAEENHGSLKKYRHLYPGSDGSLGRDFYQLGFDDKGTFQFPQAQTRRFVSVGNPQIRKTKGLSEVRITNFNKRSERYKHFIFPVL